MERGKKLIQFPFRFHRIFPLSQQDMENILAWRACHNSGQFPVDALRCSQVEKQNLSECDFKFASSVTIVVCCSFYTWPLSIMIYVRNAWLDL